MGNAQNLRFKLKLKPKSRVTVRIGARVARSRSPIPIHQSNPNTVIVPGYQCKRCPHHPILFSDELAGHRDLHKMQKTLKSSSFKDFVKIPADHPMIPFCNRRFMKRRSSRTGIPYYVLKNPIVLIRRVEEDVLVLEKHNGAVKRLNYKQEWTEDIGDNSTLPVPHSEPSSVSSKEESDEVLEDEPEATPAEADEMPPRTATRMIGPKSMLIKRNARGGGDV